MTRRHCFVDTGHNDETSLFVETGHNDETSLFVNTGHHDDTSLFIILYVHLLEAENFLGITYFDIFKTYI